MVTLDAGLRQVQVRVTVRSRTRRLGFLLTLLQPPHGRLVPVSVRRLETVPVEAVDVESRPHVRVHVNTPVPTGRRTTRSGRAPGVDQEPRLPVVLREGGTGIVGVVAARDEVVEVAPPPVITGPKGGAPTTGVVTPLCRRDVEGRRGPLRLARLSGRRGTSVQTGVLETVLLRPWSFDVEAEINGTYDTVVVPLDRVQGTLETVDPCPVTRRPWRQSTRRTVGLTG